MNVFKKIGKFFKGLFITLLIIVLLPVVALLLHPFWVGPVAKVAANKSVPGIVQTDFNLNKLNLNLYKCCFEMGEMRLGNPEGFADPDALKLGTMLVDVDTLSLFSDVIVIEKIELSDVYVSYIANAEGKYNFEVIAENCQSAEAEAVEAPATTETPAEEGMKFEIPDLDKYKLGRKEGEEAPAAEAESKPKKPVKLIIKELVVNNVSGVYMQMPFRIPSFRLTNMGADSGGYEVEVMGQAIMKEFIASIMASMTELFNGAIDLTGKGVQTLSNVSVESATEGLNNLGQSATGVVTDLGSSTGEVLSNVGQGTGEVLSNVGQGTGEVISNVGQGATDAVSSVGAATMDVINNLGTKEALKGAGDELKNAGKALKGIFK